MIVCGKITKNGIEMIYVKNGAIISFKIKNFNQIPILRK